MQTCLTEGCNGELRRVRFVDTWYNDGTPLEVPEDLYCDKCKTRWLGSPVESIEEANTLLPDPAVSMQQAAPAR